MDTRKTLVRLYDNRIIHEDIINNPDEKHWIEEGLKKGHLQWMNLTLEKRMRMPILACDK